MNLEQVFLYVTQRCNIRCITCYALDQLERDTDLSFDDLVRLLADFRTRGAWRLSLLGGEPTVYRPLGDLVARARDLGYTFVRINTNGMFATSLLSDTRMRGIDVLCFSIDGATAAVNDSIRKGSRLERVLENLRAAREAGFEVRVNATITSRNIDQTIAIVELAEACGASEVNLNVMFLMGYALTHQDLAVSPAAWRSMYDTILRRHREFAIRIKLPAAFATTSELPGHRANGHRCLAMDGTRWYVASNGQAFPCLLFMDAKQGIGQDAGAAVHDYCHFVNMPSAGLHPLCIFYKDRLNATRPRDLSGDQSIVCPPQML
jgi:MoaA/NifB/PqqE/SkfB family radical SAM enzyme